MLEWNILFYVFDTCHIFNSDGRSELPRNIWYVQLPYQFLGVLCDILLMILDLYSI